MIYTDRLFLLFPAVLRFILINKAAPIYRVPLLLLLRTEFASINTVIYIAGRAK